LEVKKSSSVGGHAHGHLHVSTVADVGVVLVEMVQNFFVRNLQFFDKLERLSLTSFSSLFKQTL